MDLKLNLFVVKGLPVSLNEKIVVAGAGMTGLMCALKLTEKISGNRIVIFDKSPVSGGMYNSVTGADGSLFDHGMHVIYESCNPEVDELYLTVMPSSDWNILEGNRKDIAGCYFRGKLQDYSHYVDLRSFSTEQKSRFLGDFFLNLSADARGPSPSATEFLEKQFGQLIVEELHKPLLKSLYSVEPEKLDVFAIKTTALDRVVAFDAPMMADLMKCDLIRARLAYPDQLNLPPYRKNTQRALYPKKFGMRHFIDRLQKVLISRGVTILTSTSAADIRTNQGQIKEIDLMGADMSQKTVSVEKLIWTGGWPALASALKVGIADIPFQRGMKIIYVNIMLSQPPLMGELYYCYCYDAGFASFRVTNYGSYCPDASTPGAFPVCVELWPSRLGLSAESISDKECERLAVSELNKMGIIDDSHQVTSVIVGSRGSEFPLPSIENRVGLNEVKARVNALNYSNIIVAGIMAEDGLFFIPDILNDAIPKILSADFSEENQ